MARTEEEVKHPAITAHAFATLSHIAPGRVVLEPYWGLPSARMADAIASAAAIRARLQHGDRG